MTRTVQADHDHVTDTGEEDEYGKTDVVSLKDIGFCSETRKAFNQGFRKSTDTRHWCGLQTADPYE